MTTPTRPDPPKLHLTATQRELVDLFELNGPAVLTNWIKRYAPDPETGLSKAEPFPEPDDRRRYDLDEVVAWARRPDTPATLRPRPEWWWRRAVAAWQDALHNEARSGAEVSSNLRSYVAALVLGVAVIAGQVRRVRARRDLIEELRRVEFAPSAMEVAALEMEAAAPALADLLAVPLRAIDPPAWLRVDFIEHLERASLHGVHPAEQLDIALDELGGNRTWVSDTAAVLADLVSGLMPTSGVHSIYDPCAGEGRLVAVAARKTRSRVRIHAQELDAGASRIARTRFLLRGLDAEMGEPGRSSIGEDQFPTLRADLVVADPPVSPNSPLVDWVDHVYRHLAPRGRALIVLPRPALVESLTTSARRRPEAALIERLEELLGEGAVARVVDVPLRLRRDVAGSLTVWELRELHASREQLVFRWTVKAPQRTTSTNSELPEDVWREHPATADEVWQWLQDPSARPDTSMETSPRDTKERPVSRLIRAIDDLDVDLGLAPEAERSLERKLEEIRELLGKID